MARVDTVRAEDLPGYLGALGGRWQAHKRNPPHLLDSEAGVVLVGAGEVGQLFLKAIRASGDKVLAFADNNSAKWGTAFEGVDVLSPADAAVHFGSIASFVVTVGRLGTEATHLRQQFERLGVGRVRHFTEVVSHIPQTWPSFFLNPDAFVDQDPEDSVAAYRLLADETSRHLFLTHLAWRMTVDSTDLPVPTYCDQYFPSGVITPSHCEEVVDVGAYTGDTLLTLSEFAGESLRRYYAFEPDPRSHEQLVRCAESVVAGRPDLQVSVRWIAIGATSGETNFSGGGATTSQVDPSGLVKVPRAPLDDVGLVGPTLIKIDVEGSEGDVLRGARRTIQTSRPAIAIATYHRPRDLFDLPLQISRCAPGYRFYLRSHGDVGIDLVCYAIGPS